MRLTASTYYPIKLNFQRNNITAKTAAPQHYSQPQNGKKLVFFLSNACISLIKHHFWNEWKLNDILVLLKVCLLKTKSSVTNDLKHVSKCI